MDQPITVVLADDHTLVRTSLANWLAGAPDIQVIALVDDAQSAVAESARSRPDVVVLDIDMPGLSSFDAARSIRGQSPGTRIIYLSAFIHDRYIEQALQTQASGYLNKGESPESLVRAIRAAKNGEVYFSPEVQARIVVDTGGVKLATREKTRVSTLTVREIEVLRYIARGMSKKEVAQVMGISLKTVDHHTANMMKKLNIHDRVELARFAIREGLAEP